MLKAPAALATALVGLTACADVGAMPTIELPPSTAAAPVAAPPTAVTEAAFPAFGPVWQVRHATCAQLLAAPEPARREELMFYYGYFAARNGIATISQREIHPVRRRVIEQCARTPNMAVADAFQERLATPPRWFWQMP